MSFLPVKPNHDRLASVKDRHGAVTIQSSTERGKQSERGHRRRLTTEEFVAQARAVHGDRYDYSRTVYVLNAQKLSVICREHGPFMTYPYHHTTGGGCPSCNGRNKSKAMLQAGMGNFLRQSAEKHGTKYDYSKAVYTGYNTKVIIGCPIHGDFEQTPAIHYRGSGCPKCGTANRVRLQKGRKDDQCNS